MQHIKIDCKDLLSAINATIVQVREIENAQAPVKNTTMSDTDPIGAVKFTVAVVLLYGVGVIGLLGITARRNRRLEMMDKEVNKYLKNEFGRHSFKRKPKPKTAISKLISAIHTPSKSEESQSNSRLKNKLIQKCSTWSGGMDGVCDYDHPSLDVTTKTVSMSLLDQSRPCIITGYSLVPTNDSPLLTGTAQTSTEYHVPPFYQELHTDNLEPIDEENDDEFSENGDNNSDTNLKEVRVVTPEEEMQIKKGVEVNTPNVTNKRLRNYVVQTSLPCAMISDDTTECSNRPTSEDTALDTTERNNSISIHNNTPTCGRGVDFY